jgi:hypothetical protein
VSVVGDAASTGEFEGVGAALWAAAARSAPAWRPAPEAPWAPPRPAAPPPPLPLWPYPRCGAEVAAGLATGDPRVNLGVTEAVLAAAGGAAAVGAAPQELDFAVAVPTSVNFVVKRVPLGTALAAPEAAPCAPAPYALPPPLPARPPTASAALHPAVAVANTGVLWERVRVAGGAYGGGLGIDGPSRSATFYSYRDPHLERTLAAFDGVARELRERGAGGGRAAEREVAHAVISTIGEWDAPSPPKARGAEAVARWVAGASEPLEQARREAVLGAGPAALVALGEALEGGGGARGRIAVVGGEDALGKWSARGARPRLTLKPLAGKGE